MNSKLGKVTDKKEKRCGNERIVVKFVIFSKKK